MSEYKRGTETIDGRRYGFYPDGSRFRIYENDTPFITLVDVHGITFLRVRQATEIGHVDCPVCGVVDIAYPTSGMRRGRMCAGGLVNALTCGQRLVTLVEL